MHTYIHAHIHTCTHTYMHTYIHTHTVKPDNLILTPDLAHLKILDFGVGKSVKKKDRLTRKMTACTGTVRYMAPEVCALYRRTYIYICMNKHTYIHTYIDTYMKVICSDGDNYTEKTFIYTHTHTHVCMNIHTYTHTYMKVICSEGDNYTEKA